ncbi:MAG: type II toxin-antitoxin system VapC family toxin [Deltaproteobacteria bacterium]|nr:type II toxin-antitoxin system VapC family toxin [Deltaproteobacteria bacterium]
MIIPDLNLLVYAYNESAPLHGKARAFWEKALSRDLPVGVPWVVALGFVRLTTHPRVLAEPLSPSAALARVEAWFSRPAVRIVEPGPQHLVILRRLFEATGVAASLTTDTHLAALAIEYQAELISNDSDFGRFPGLRWRNPLAA